MRFYSTALKQTVVVRKTLSKDPSGKVYRVIDENKREYYLKMIDLTDQNRKKIQERMIYLKQLDNTHIPKYYDLIESDHGSGILIEAIDGINIGDLIAQKQRLTPDMEKRVLDQGLDILNYLAHQKPPVIHGNITSKDLILDQNGQLWLTGLERYSDCVLKDDFSAFGKALLPLFRELIDDLKGLIELDHTEDELDPDERALFLKKRYPLGNIMMTGGVLAGVDLEKLSPVEEVTPRILKQIKRKENIGNIWHDSGVQSDRFWRVFGGLMMVQVMIGMYIEAQFEVFGVLLGIILVTYLYWRPRKRWIELSNDGIVIKRRGTIFYRDEIIRWEQINHAVHYNPNSDHLRHGVAVLLMSGEWRGLYLGDDRDEAIALEGEIRWILQREKHQSITMERFMFKTGILPRVMGMIWGTSLLLITLLLLLMGIGGWFLLIPGGVGGLLLRTRKESHIWISKKLISMAILEDFYLYKPEMVEKFIQRGFLIYLELKPNPLGGTNRIIFSLEWNQKKGQRAVEGLNQCLQSF